MARSSQGHSARNWLAGFLLVLALTALAPQPALAFSLSDIVNGSIANPASVFAAATNAGSQTFTNYVLYEQYDMLNRWTGGVTTFLYEASGYMDNLSSLPSEVRTIRTSASSLVTTLNNVSASLRNTSGSAISALQSLSADVSTLLGRSVSGGASFTGWLQTLAGRMVSSSGASIANILDSSNSILSTLLGRTVDGDASVAQLGTQIVNRLTTSSGSPLAQLYDSRTATIISSLSTLLGRLVDGGASVAQLGTRLVNRLTTSDGAPLADLLDSRTSSMLSSLSTLLGRLVDGDASVAQLGTQLVSRLTTSAGAGLADLFSGRSSTIIDLLSGIPGYISDAASSVVGALGNVAITFPDSITATLEPGTTITAGADVAGEAAQAGTLWDTIVGDVDTAQIQGQMDATVGVLRTSFPFGCIFVLSDALSALIASPVAPVFEADLPMIAGTYHAEIDLSFFDGVAALLRGGMVVVYVAGLYSATKHWVFNGGGESA